MIPRLLVPMNARPPAADTPTTRRRPSTLDQRTLVPAMLPIVELDGRSNIPSSLPLESIAARTVVPRGLKREEAGLTSSTWGVLIGITGRSAIPATPSVDNRN